MKFVFFMGFRVSPFTFVVFSCIFGPRIEQAVDIRHEAVLQNKYSQYTLLSAHERIAPCALSAFKSSLASYPACIGGCMSLFHDRLPLLQKYGEEAPPRLHVTKTSVRKKSKNEVLAIFHTNTSSDVRQRYTAKTHQTKST